MRRLKTPQPYVIAMASLVIIGAAILLAFMGSVWHNNANGGQVSKTDKSDQVHNSPSKSTTNNESQAPETSDQEVAPAESSSPACKQFTLVVAKQVLGNKATVSQTESGVSADSGDAQTSTCVYVSDAGSVRLVAHIAKTEVGKSTNSVSFGSGKPAGVQDTPGYGQAAYWDEQTNVLSVLKDNNFYEISRSSNAKTDVLKAADTIVPKL